MSKEEQDVDWLPKEYYDDEKKDAIRSLDLLYNRVVTEILKREDSPAMRLLNDLLNMHDGFDDEGWLKECERHMVSRFPPEDPFILLVPADFDISKVSPVGQL
ncbi:hypothetical protein RJ641_030386 [Dillenia turbinata]|uniref:Uncharacterized protein n=1 Tax=Dillenia turbinata TaxID=194707 RepID=A0AAN8VVP4_9MAGN